MDSLPIDRAHPPSRVVYTSNDRYLELRPWRHTDIDDLNEALESSRTEMRPFMTWVHAPITREAQYELITRVQGNYFSGRSFVFGMFSEKGDVLGGAGLHDRVPMNPNGLEIGYWCCSAHTGKGNATLASRLLVFLAFDYFRCDRLQLMHDEANTASQRVAEKSGFLFEGIMRNATQAATPELREGGFRGTGRHRLYALIPSDLPSLPWLEDLRANTQLFNAQGTLMPKAGRIS